MKQQLGLVCFLVASYNFVKSENLESDSKPSGCPSFDEIPVSRPTGGDWPEFYAGRRYEDLGNEVPELACNGLFHDAVEKYHTGTASKCINLAHFM